MIASEDLSLRLVCLQKSESLVPKDHTLSFVFPNGGDGKFTLGEISQPLTPGAALVFNGNNAVINVPRGGELTFWTFSLNVDHLFPLLSIRELRLFESVESIFKNTKLYPPSSSVARKCHRLLDQVSPSSSLRQRTELLGVVAIVLSREFENVLPRLPSSVSDDEHWDRLLEQLSVQDIVTLTSEELAARVHCSSRHLNRRFHQYFGVSVGALRLEMRLLKAASLLRDSELKIMAVAQRSGFNYLGLFNTSFKRRFGMSPGSWRKSMWQAKATPPALTSGDSNCLLRSNGLCPW